MWKRRPRSLILSIQTRYSALSWWAGKDSNLGSRWQQIYSLPPLSTWVPARTSQNFHVSALWAQKQTIPNTALLLLVAQQGLLFRMDNQPIPEAGNFTGDIDICQVGVGSFCIFTASRANWGPVPYHDRLFVKNMARMTLMTLWGGNTILLQHTDNSKRLFSGVFENVL